MKLSRERITRALCLSKVPSFTIHNCIPIGCGQSALHKKDLRPRRSRDNDGLSCGGRFAMSKQCMRCGEDKPASDFNRDRTRKDGLRIYCKDCMKLFRDETFNSRRDYQKQYRASRANEIGKQRREHYRLNAERIRERNRKQYTSLSEATKKERNRKLYWRDVELNKKRAREYQQANREKIRPKATERNRLWRQNNPDKAIAIKQKRRAGEANGVFSASEWKAIKKQYQYMCLCCGKREPEVRLTPDHVVPLALGGSNEINNIQPLCLPCNTRKGTKTIDYRTKQRLRRWTQGQLF